MKWDQLVNAGGKNSLQLEAALSTMPAQGSGGPGPYPNSNHDRRECQGDEDELRLLA